MSKAEHTPEPWDDTEFVGDDGRPPATAEDVAAMVASSTLEGGAFLYGVTVDGLVDEQGRSKVVCYTGNGPASAANSRRIVACVNACQGISTEALADGAVSDLLAACERWDKGFTDGEEFTEEQFLAWVNANRRAAREAAARAKAEGGAP